MKSICKKTTCLLVFFLLTSLMTVASMQTVSVTTLDDYAPYTFKQENATIGNMETIPPGEDSNVLQGYSWDILRESFHSQGWTIELTVIPWARAMNNFDNGEVEVLFPTGKNNERLVIYNYSKNPVNQVNFQIYMNADSTLKWSGLESLSGKKIAVRRNFNLGNDWNQIVDTMSLYEINSIEQGFMMLQAKRVEGFAGYDINWDYFLNNSKNFQTSSFKKLPPFGKSEEYVATLKSNPRSEKILTTFDEGFDTICKNGVFETIKAKWLGE